MLAAAFCAAVGYYISGGRGLADVWPTAVFTALVTGAGNIINDYHDVDIDRINKPRRPLPSGRISARVVVALYTVLTVFITVGTFLFLPFRVAVLMIVWEASLYIYARWAKRASVLGNLLVSAVASSAFIAGGLLTDHPGECVVAVGIAFVFMLSRELVKEAEDVEGDTAADVHSTAVVVGLDQTVLWASGMMMLLAVAIPLPTLTGYYSVFYLWVMELSVVPGLVAASYLILKYPCKRIFNRVCWILKVEIFFGILAVGVGKL